MVQTRNIPSHDHPFYLQVAGPHIATYESYHKQADPTGSGAIPAVDAALFLKKSGLSDGVLSQVGYQII